MAYLSHYLRDPSLINKHFKKINNSLIALKDCSVFFPKIYEQKALATISDEVSVLGVLMFQVDSTYAVMNLNAMVHFTPIRTDSVNIDGEDYYQMVFEAGSRVIPELTVVKRDTLPYLVYDLFISNGKIPFYMGYLDMCRLFDTAKAYADADVGTRPEVIQLLVSLIARSKSNQNKYYRQVISDKTDESDLKFIPIKSVAYGATNTVNRLGGSGFKTGVISSLIYPADKVENIESILRQ